MASFKGTSLITDLDAKTAQIIDDFFVQNGPEQLLNWIEQNQIKALCWWDYQETKQKTPSVVLAPFYYFKELDLDHQNAPMSLRYLEIPYETALTILTLGTLPTS